MVRALSRFGLAGLGLATALSACSAGPLSDRLPESLGGMPAGVPTRPATPYQYPAVHDMPPARSTEPMNDDEQWKLEKELRAARDRQEAVEGQGGQGAAKKTVSAPNKKPVPPAKKQSGDVIVVPPTGAKTSGTKTNP
jgi:hypothetical protein